MKLTETPLKGAFIIDPELIEDDRGFFARTFCATEFADHGLETRFLQCSTSYNRFKGTLRGLHFQAPPNEEVKLVRVTSGAVYDVIVDLRAGSPTYWRWAALELTARNRRMLYVPSGFAHGFQTLEDDTEVVYQISEFYIAEASRGVRWDAPSLAIQWPETQRRVVSAHDMSLPLALS